MKTPFFIAFTFLGLCTAKNSLCANHHLSLINAGEATTDSYGVPQIAPCYSYSPLMKASLEGNSEKVSAIIDQSNSEDKTKKMVNKVVGRDQPRAGYPVLRYAIDGDSVEVVKILLDAGANANDFTFSPFFYNGENAQLKACSPSRNLQLLSHAIRRYYGLKQHNSPKQHDALEIVQILVDHGADIHGESLSDIAWTPLIVARSIQNEDSIPLSILKGTYQPDMKPAK